MHIIGEEIKNKIRFAACVVLFLILVQLGSFVAMARTTQAKNDEIAILKGKLSVAEAKSKEFKAVKGNNADLEFKLSLISEYVNTKCTCVDE